MSKRIYERIKENDFTIMHGPCSLESKEQMEQIIDDLGGISPYFRSGIYKPRTSPDSFQGLKEEGLDILRELKEEHPEMVTIVEITSPEYLENIGDIDIIQIGARNMQNYELLIAAGKTQKPILLKRGFGATVQELINSAEYIKKQGNEQIILCERGIRTFSETSRFTLDFSAIGYLKENTPYPVFVDPSHAGGSRDEVKRLTRATAGYGSDGIIIEVHPKPELALSDADQQLNIPEYQELIKDVKNIIGR